MMNKTVISLAFATAFAVALGAMPTAYAETSSTELVTNGPQASRGDWGGWSARRNVIESRHYDRALEMSPGFRHARMRKECGPINDPQLHADCIASFGQLEPYAGSTMPPYRHRYHRGAGE
jgi:hypothetical protein